MKLNEREGHKMENTTKKNETAKVEAKANQVTSKVNDAFIALCKGTVDAKSLLAFGEKNIREALSAIKAFKKADEDQKKADAEKLQAINDLLISAGLVNPSIDINTIRGIKKSSINCLYHALAARPSGATWKELEELTAKENQRDKLQGDSQVYCQL
jgi:LPS O-antigen subunit length determinant protein (WzzB/FepE family)